MKKIKKFLILACLLLLFVKETKTVDAANSLDIVFIIDRSYSINISLRHIRNELNNFALQLQNTGIDYRLGLITYEEDVSNYGLTTDVETFNHWLHTIMFDGDSENGFDAIREAVLRTNFRKDAAKHIVLIGSEVIRSKGNSGYTSEDVRNTLKHYNIKLTAVGTDDTYGQFISMAGYTGGQYLSIYSDFGTNLNMIFEQMQVIPQISINAPLSDSYYGGTKNTFIPSINVKDEDGDLLTCKLYVDNDTTPWETKTVTNTKTSQLVSFSTFNVSSLSEGAHTLKFTVDDARNTVQASTSIIIDKSAPSMSNVTFSSSDTAITITGNGKDLGAGLESTPYRYTINDTVSGWGTNSSNSYNALTPNTLYYAKFEIRDKVGNITTLDKNMYTKAQTPGITVRNISETSFDIIITDNNPSSTMYKIVSSQFPSAQWQTAANKTIRVSNLQPGADYSFSLQAKNSESVETNNSSPIFCRTLSLAPSNVILTPSRNSMTISWSASAGSTSYEVEVDEGAILSTGSSTSYTHTGLRPGTQHTYRIRTVNGSGNGKWSQKYTMYTIIDPPVTPSNFNTINITNKLVSLEWDWVADAFGYQIQINDTTIIDITDGDKLNHIFSDIKPDTTYTYRLRAYNVGGKSEWTQSLKVTTLPDPPNTPENIDTEISKYKVILSWPSVERAETYWIMVDGVKIDNGNKTTYVHENLISLSGHTYKIKAVNRGGESAWSETIDVTTWPEEPVTPTNILATSGKTSSSLSWYRVPYAASYEVEIDGTTIKSVTEEAFVHKVLSEGTHSYRVRAKNISGYSDWSREIKVATLPLDNNAVSLTNVIAVVTTNSIMISWDAKAYEGQYDIEVDGVLYNNGSNTIYNHTGLEPDSYHTYRIRVRDRSGLEQWCSTLYLSTMSPLPDAPVDVEAHAENSSVKLVWSRVEGSEGYDLLVDGELVQNVMDSVYNHTNLQSGTSHTYRVRAKNAAGVTAWSSSVTISTKSPTYVIDCKEGELFEFSILGDNIQDFSNMTFIVKYNPKEIKIVDLYRGTPAKDTMNEGSIPGTNIKVKFMEGLIEIKLNESVIPGTSWSGEITSLLFEAISTGSSSLDLIVE